MDQAKAPSSTTALVLGLLALFLCGIFAGIPAIIFGNRTMREIHESGGRLGGSGAGRFAQIIGWFTVLYLPIVAVVAIIVMSAE